MTTLRKAFWHAFEWRCWAYLLTIPFLYLTGSDVLTSIINSFWLQVWLLVGHVGWLKLRTRLG